MRALRDLHKLNISDDAVRMATGFGGGLGHADCLCGALTGATMILGLLQRRATPAEGREPAYAGANQFHALFREKFGSTCCRVFNPHPFDTREHLRNCLKITGGTAELLSNFLAEQGLVKLSCARY